MRKALIVGCALAGTLLLLPAGASAAQPTCNFAAGTLTVTLNTDPESAAITIRRSGTNIQVLDATGTPVPCGGGTVTDTETIEVVDAAAHDTAVNVSLQGGLFAPGADATDPGTPEIDFDIDLGGGTDALAVEGTDNADSWVLGEDAGGVAGANLNAGEPSFDTDLIASGVEVGRFSGRGGADQITAAGNAAFLPLANPLALGSLMLEGNNQDDDLRGGSGSDSVVGGTQDDNVRGGAGDDFIDGGDQDDKADGGVGADVIEGGTGTDRVFYDDRTLPVTATIGGGADDGTTQDAGAGGRDNVGFSVEHLTGGSAGDSVTGSSIRNVLNGGEGDDIMLGLEGNDDVEGEGGNDDLDGGSGNDKVEGGDGEDTGDGGGGSDDLFGGGSGDRLLGGNKADFLRGDKGRDRMSGQGGNDKINAKDKKRDRRISCGKGKAKRESAKVDKVDPKAKSC